MKIKNTGCSLQHTHTHISDLVTQKQQNEKTVRESKKEKVEDDNKRDVSFDLLEFDGEWEGVEEHVDLEDAEEEETEVIEHLSEEIPEETDVRGQVRYRQTGERDTGVKSGTDNKSESSILGRFLRKVSSP